jgi:hypothetical protein
MSYVIQHVGVRGQKWGVHRSDRSKHVSEPVFRARLARKKDAREQEIQKFGEDVLQNAGRDTINDLYESQSNTIQAGQDHVNSINLTIKLKES